MVYRVAHAYEQATRWIDRHPPVAVRPISIISEDEDPA